MTNPHTNNLYAPPAAPMAAEAPVPGWAGFGFLRRVAIVCNGVAILTGPVMLLLLWSNTPGPAASSRSWSFWSARSC